MRTGNNTDQRTSFANKVTESPRVFGNGKRVSFSSSLHNLDSDSSVDAFHVEVEKNVLFESKS